VVLQPNITCTMEPLYMIPGRMGFHVEDMYRITPTGFEAITGAITPNDQLIRIGLMSRSCSRISADRPCQ